MRNRNVSCWRSGAHIGVVMAGTCGLLLFAGGTSFARSADTAAVQSLSPLGSWPGLSNWLGSGVRYIPLGPGFACPSWVDSCISGPVDSGNVKNAQNVYLWGNVNDSGSPTNINGSPNSGNESHENSDHDQDNQ